MTHHLQRIVLSFDEQLWPLVTEISFFKSDIGILPPTLKHATIQLALNKLSVDTTDLCNYCLVSNLLFVSQLLCLESKTCLKTHLSTVTILGPSQLPFMTGFGTGRGGRWTISCCPGIRGRSQYFYSWTLPQH